MTYTPYAMDGRLFLLEQSLLFAEVPPPYAIGTITACQFSEGAMAAGASPERALELAIKRCIYVGGEVQKVYLKA